MARHGAVRPTHPQAAVPGPVIWSKAEDDLLLAITHEFGVNWTMVRGWWQGKLPLHHWVASHRALWALCKVHGASMVCGHRACL